MGITHTYIGWKATIFGKFCFTIIQIGQNLTKIIRNNNLVKVNKNYDLVNTNKNNHLVKNNSLVNTINSNTLVSNLNNNVKSASPLPQSLSSHLSTIASNVLFSLTMWTTTLNLVQNLVTFCAVPTALTHLPSTEEVSMNNLVPARLMPNTLAKHASALRQEWANTKVTSHQAN